MSGQARASLHESESAAVEVAPDSSDDGGPAPRLLCEIAEEIRATWRPPFYGAVPYLNAMARLGPLTDTYGADSARSVVAYFLTNAGRWHGPTAQRIKAELREMTGQ